VFWFDGALRERPVVSFDLTDRGLNLGDGIFDTSLARNGRIFRRKSHIDRMADAAEILGIPFDEELAGNALDALAQSVGDGAIRLTLTRGAGPRGKRTSATSKSRLSGDCPKTCSPSRICISFSSQR